MWQVGLLANERQIAPKGAWSGSRDPLLKFGTSYYLCNGWRYKYFKFRDCLLRRLSNVPQTGPLVLDPIGVYLRTGTSVTVVKFGVNYGGKARTDTAKLMNVSILRCGQSWTLATGSVDLIGYECSSKINQVCEHSGWYGIEWPYCKAYFESIDEKLEERSEINSRPGIFECNAWINIKWIIKLCLRGEHKPARRSCEKSTDHCITDARKYRKRCVS